MGALSKVLILLGIAAIAAALFVGLLPVNNGCGSAFLPITNDSGPPITSGGYVFTNDHGYCFPEYRTPRIVAGALGIIAALLFLAAYMFRTTRTPSPEQAAMTQGPWQADWPTTRPDRQQPPRPNPGPLPPAHGWPRTYGPRPGDLPPPTLGRPRPPSPR
jgi:hypothetical protein